MVSTLLDVGLSLAMSNDPEKVLKAIKEKSDITHMYYM